MALVDTAPATSPSGLPGTHSTHSTLDPTTGSRSATRLREAEQRRHRSRVPAVVLSVAALAAAWLATWRLGTPSQVGDEVVYRTAAAAMLRGDFSQNLEHPPLVKELLAAAQWAGAHAGPLGLDDVLASRMVGVVCFLLTGLVVAATARRLRSPAAGVTAAALWWFLPLAPGVIVGHVDRYALLEAPLLLAVAGVVHLAVVLTLQERPRVGTWLLAGLLVGLATGCKLPGALSAGALLVPLAAQVWRAARPAEPKDDDDADRADRAAGPVLSRGRAVRPLTTAVAVLASAVLAAVVSVAVFLVTYLPFGDAAPAAVRTVVQAQLVHAGTGHVQTVAGVNYDFPPWWSQWWFQAQYLGWAAAAVLHALALLWLGSSLRTAARDADRAHRRRTTAGLVLGVHLLVVAAALAGMSLKLPHYSGLLQAPLAVAAGCALAWLAAVAVGRGGRRRSGGPALVRAATRAVAAAVVVAAAVPLAMLAAHHAVIVATVRVADYRAVAGAVVAAGLERSPAVVWADRGAVAAVLHDLVGSRDLPADGRPALVIVDDTVVDRLPGGYGRAWLDEHADEYAQRHDGRVTVLVRQASPQAAQTEHATDQSTDQAGADQ